MTKGAPLPPRIRKLVGSIALLLFVALYALGAARLGSMIPDDMPAILMTLYFIIAGFLWVIPAGALIYWMQRMDRG
jgi:hypothetical protein